MEPTATRLWKGLTREERRWLLRAFLDALGLPHEDGLLQDVAAAPLQEPATREAARQLLARILSSEIETYSDALWLQDPQRWRDLERCREWPG